MGDPSGRRVPRGDRAFHGIVAGLWAAVLVASFLGVDRRFDGAREGPGRSVCLFRQATGLPCPTCGMTRSFGAIGRGAVGEAFRRHPLGPVVFLLLAVVGIRSAGIFLTGRRWLVGTARVLVGSLPFLVGAALVVWVVRLVWMFGTGEVVAAWRASALGQCFSVLGARF